MEAGPDTTASPGARSAPPPPCWCSWPIACPSRPRSRPAEPFTRPAAARLLVACAALALALALAGCKRRATPPPPRDGGDPLVVAIDQARARGAAFLIARQEADGAIRSPTYAAFRDGYALTGLAAMALGQSEGPEAAAAYRRAVDFVAGLAARDRPVAYPTYATALAVLVLDGPGNQRHAAARDRLMAALRDRQLGSGHGWRPDDASFGGWGYYPGVPRRPDGAITDELLSANLSATVLAVGALTLGGVSPDDPALAEARRFVESCQARVESCRGEPCPGDGGFFFSPAVPDGNKAGLTADGRPRSYGSMTADGVRALIRLGAGPADPAVAEAGAWLEARFDPAHNPGDFPPEAEVRRESSYYYWTWTAAHALQRLGKRELAGAAATIDWPRALAGALLARQGADGAWRNRFTEMREDDPVVATSFALAALTVSRAVVTGEHPSHAAWR